ncbi:MAG: hypothetical protein F6K63_14230 [Moorea sp. SIO1G6]|uniref:hypothetical protein n=1 Tax=Moorena sp. SIO1G6 TaxID=2607840 RepID=UPI0013BF10C3|nr:hypothetical protein [Moorena sp. SIO1G6]NET65474.1 hypothetical protein [Moorena sp. SIO1G6]
MLRLASEVRSQKSEVRSQKLEVRSQKSEVRSQRLLTFRSLGAMQRLHAGGFPHERLHQDNVKHLNA